MARTFALASTEYLEIDSAAILTYPLTMACWFNVADITNSHALMFVGDKDAGNKFTSLTAAGSRTGDPIEAFSHSYGAASAARAESSTGYSASTWHHACGVWASASSRIAYLDGGGAVEDTVTVNAMASHDRTSIGRLGDSSPGFYTDGAIAEAAIWSTTLTAPMVAGLAAGISPLLLYPKFLVFYVPLIRDDDNDLVGGLSLTAFNTPTVSEHTRIYNPVPAAMPFIAGIDTIYLAKGDIFLYTSANWSPTPTWYFEATLKADSGSTANARLYDLTSSAEVTSSAISTTNTTDTRVRSAAITLVDGREYEAQLGSRIDHSGTARGATIIGVV